MDRLDIILTDALHARVRDKEPDEALWEIIEGRLQGKVNKKKRLIEKIPNINRSFRVAIAFSVIFLIGIASFYIIKSSDLITDRPANQEKQSEKGIHITNTIFSVDYIKATQIGQKDNWIYFYYKNNDLVNTSSILNNTGVICRARTDGTESMQITEDQTEGACIIDDWIFYINQTDQYRLYMVSTDGTEKRKFFVDVQALHFEIVNGWIYYTNKEGQFRVGMDGAYVTKLNKSVMNRIDKEGIYFINESILYKQNLDGSKTVPFSIPSPITFEISNGWVYYNAFSIYKIKTDQTGGIQLSGDITGNMLIQDDWIYYTKKGTSNNVGLYKITIDGSRKSKLTEKDVENFKLVGKSIYFTLHGSNGLYKMDINGNEIKKIAIDIQK